MNRQETLAIMSVLKAAYPMYYRDMKRDEANAVVDLWNAMLVDYDPMEVTVAVKSHIATDKKGFPPHIGAIIDAIQKNRTRDSDLTELEAWHLVEKATRRSTYYAEEEFNKLPPVVQQIVREPSQLREWASMPEDDLKTIVASNFQRSYRAKAQHVREYMALPSDVRNNLEALSGGMKQMELMPWEGGKDERKTD